MVHFPQEVIRAEASSLDLRDRAVRFVEGGHSCHAAAARFSVSVSFVVRLMTAFRINGSLKPKASGGRRHAKLDPHKAFLIARIEEYANITMPVLAAELAASTGTRADPRLALTLSHPQRLPLQKKPCWQARKIAPMSKRRAKNGPASANRACGLSRRKRCRHHGQFAGSQEQGEKAIDARGAWVLFLPPYSPDLNPIEMAFAKLKAHLRARAIRTIDALWQEIGRICDLFEPAECQTYFAAAGYGFG